jgi:ribosomal-protein-alanine N-acetyltransferase
MNYLGSKTLETKRLILHKTEEKDLKELWNILCLEEVNKYYLITKINFDWEEDKKWQYKKLENSSNNDVFCWTIEIKETEEIIGQISLTKTQEKDVFNIGWFIEPTFQKKGYAYESALEVLKFMFLEVEIKSIKTCAAIVNPSSWQLMEKLGFKRLKTTSFIKYTFVEDKVKCLNYSLTKNDFLKEYFRKERLYIEEEIDKDPYIKHINDYPVLNLTGESGSGKSTATLEYKNNNDIIVIDTDIVFGKNEKDEVNKTLYDYLINKYNKLPSLINEFDIIYQDILDCFKDSNKMLIIDSAQFRNLKDISLLKGDIIILRTSINNCYQRCIDRFKSENNNASFEEIASYCTRKKDIYKWYHSLNSFIDRVDKLNEDD